MNHHKDPASGDRVTTHVVRRVRRADWRQGGRTVRNWDAKNLSFALLAVGLAMVGSAALGRISFPWASVSSTLTLWAGLIAAVTFAFARARPAGLLKLRSIDLLWGLGLGIALRLVQGWLTNAQEGPFPSAPTLDGSLSLGWWFTVALAAGIVAPVLEELVFRAVILVTVYQLFRKSVGGFAAGVTACLASAGTFVALHSTSGLSDFIDAMQLFAVGLVCSLCVVLTGRVWAAIFVHIVYNASYLVLVVAGTVLASP
jgi:uncharacterized protein